MGPKKRKFQKKSVVIYITYVGDWEHNAALESCHPSCPTRFFKESNVKARNNEVIFGFCFDNIFDHIVEGQRYDCEITQQCGQSVIEKVVLHSTESRHLLYLTYFPFPTAVFLLIDNYAFPNYD